MKWSVKIFFDRELHRMHLRKSSLQNSSALVQTLFLQKSTEKSLLIPMRSIKSAQCYISRTISRRQKFFCENRPIFGMIRDAEVRGGERMQTETKSKALHSVFIDTESKTYLFDGKPMQGMLGLDLHIEPDNNYVTIKYCLECRQVTG